MARYRQCLTQHLPTPHTGVTSPQNLHCRRYDNWNVYGLVLVQIYEHLWGYKKRIAEFWYETLQ